MARDKASRLTQQQVMEHAVSLRIWVEYTQMRTCVLRLRKIRSEHPALYRDVMRHIRAEDRGENVGK